MVGRPGRGFNGGKELGWDDNGDSGIMQGCARGRRQEPGDDDKLLEEGDGILEDGIRKLGVGGEADPTVWSMVGQGSGRPREWQLATRIGRRNGRVRRL